MEQTLTIQKDLAAFLQDWAYELWDREELIEFIQLMPDTMITLAFGLRDRIQADDKMSQEVRKSLGEYNMTV